MLPPKSWSFSKHSDFETCKKMFFLKHVDRIPEPERPLPPGKSEQANDRGTRVHTSCELFVNGTEDVLCPEADKFFGWQLELMRLQHAEGLVSLEGEWGMSKDWEIADWKTAWLRLKLDSLVFHSSTEATVIDYKTGKKFGNEVKHSQQLILYILTSFLRYPQLERVTGELWYLDQNEVTRQTMTRDQALRFKKNWDMKGNAITSCVDFPANPSVFTCKWCAYGTHAASHYAAAGTGHCLVGVRK
ncbi:MAG: PD-(D/E)XK nuclease family protein [Proteobacteria bacterium]|nr:PD-(D/E)XK nuclease family protein [Pseudomonadota bacterium]